jgi:HSP20 family protein
MRSQLEKANISRGLAPSSPWSGLMDLQKSMNKLFSDLDFPWTQGLEQKFDFAPSCESAEIDKEITVKFDVPGIRKEDIKVQIQNNRLSISGERKEEKSEKKGKNHFSEVFYGSFERSFTLPAEVLADKVSAECKDGVLTIHVPKADMPKAKPVEIH